MVHDEMATDEGMNVAMSAAPLIAAAVAAGVAAYLIRRSKKAEEETKIETPAAVAAAAWERAQDPAFRQRAAETTRDWVMDRVIPELKPILLDLLKGVKELVDQGFRRAEKTIKDL